MPWLLGALLFTTAASMRGLALALWPWTQTAALSLLGVGVGSALTAAVVERVTQWPVSMGGMVLLVLLAVPAGVVYCRRVMKLDPVTATFAGMPGALSVMVLTGIRAGADPRAVSLTHSARLALILLAVPPAVTLLMATGIGGADAPALPLGPLSATDAGILLACAVAGPAAGRLLRLPSPVLLGALLASAAAHVAGLTDARPPDWLLSAVQLLVGCHIGSRFANTTRQEVLRLVGQSVGLTALLLGLAAAVSWGVTGITGFPALAVFLAFVPGGIAEMSLVAVVMNLDPVFVAAHHIFRVLLVYPLSGVLQLWWDRAATRRAGED